MIGKLSKGLASVVLLFAWGGPLFAVDLPCVIIDSVQQSAISSNNNAVGGHLNKHIFDAVAPNVGSSAMDASMYQTKEGWAVLWQAISGSEAAGGVICKTNGSSNKELVVPISQIDEDHRIAGWKCKAVSSNNNDQCTSISDIFEPASYKVVFSYVDNEWIVYTSYPQQ